MNKKLVRWIGVYFLTDGLLTLFFGRKYVRLFRFGGEKSSYRKAIDWLIDLPAWKLRGAGAAEAGLGLAVLQEAPLDVVEFYRSTAGGYAAIDPGWREWFYPKAHRDFDRVLTHSLPKDGAVLDLGCGVGANLSRLEAMELTFGSYTGVDLTDAMLRRAKERYGHLPGVEFRQLDLISEPLPEGPFDLITSTWVFEHLADTERVVEKAWERLKPGGRIALLFEVKAPSLLSQFVDWFYGLAKTRLIPEAEYRRYPGEVLLESHYSGPLGDLLLLVLGKPKE